jgi:hypothetical protein
VIVMRTDVSTERAAALALLRRTRRSTRALLASMDPEQVVHDDGAGWRVRDIVGHLGVWNDEAARSLEAHAAGGEYTCIETDALYDVYNGPAARERRAWSMGEVWAEYEATHDRLEAAVAALPVERWDEPSLYPWSERGSVVGLILLMTEHETADHCEPIAPAPRQRPGNDTRT